MNRLIPETPLSTRSSAYFFTPEPRWRIEVGALLYWVFCMLFMVPSAAAETSALTAANTTASPQNALQTRLALTANEIAYIRRAKPVRVGLDANSPSLLATNAHGEAVNLVGEYFRWISEHTGLVFEPRLENSFEDILASANKGNIDLIPLFAIEKSRVPSFALTRPYLSLPIVYIVRHDLTDATPANQFNGYRVAVSKTSSSDEYLQRAMPNAQRALYPSGALALQAVSAGEADVFVGPLAFANNVINKHLLFNLDLRGELDPKLGRYSMAVTVSPPELFSILKKALDAITATEEEEMRSKWASTVNLLRTIDKQATLTIDEREWVKRHASLRVAYDREFAPFSFRGKNGELSGLSADYLKLVEQKTGLRVDSASANSWASALAEVRSGKANLLVASARNDERRAYLTFVGPYASVPTAIIARLDDRELLGIDEIALEKIAIIRAHFLIPELRRRYPGMRIEEVDNQQDALAMVANNDARAAIGNLNTIDPILQRHFLGQLRVANTVPGGDSELYFAMPKDDTMLARVLRKALDGISPAENAVLRQKWLSVNYQGGVPWRTILQVGLPILIAALLVLAVTLWANRKLKKEVMLRTYAEQQTAEALRVTRAMSEAKSRFLAVMSHEVRGPVSGIVGTADALLRHGKLADQRKSILLIRDSGEYLIRMLTHVLDFSKAEAGKFTPLPEWVSLTSLIEHAINPFRFLAEQKNIAVNTSFDPTLAKEHEVDALRLRQVITNLVSNAIKFTQQGAIDISVRAESLADNRQILSIRVQDTGSGIPAYEREKLFQPYSQGILGSRRADSTGLGLTISKEVMERLGGTLRLVEAGADVPAVGSCFEIAITVPVSNVSPHVAAPISVGADDTESAVMHAPSKPSVTSSRVLLADDDPINLSLHLEVLEGAGFIVDTATNGREALDLWRKHHHTLVFTDASMPVMSGKQFVEAVRAEQVQATTKPWIVLLTSYSSLPEQSEYVATGVDDFIEKPLLPRDLQEALARQRAGT